MDFLSFKETKSSDDQMICPRSPRERNGANAGLAEPKPTVISYTTLTTGLHLDIAMQIILGAPLPKLAQ